MLWSYVQLDDGTQFAYSETREDRTVCVAPYPPDALNAESLKAIRDGDAFMATKKPGRFDNAADLIDAALKVPEM